MYHVKRRGIVRLVENISVVARHLAKRRLILPLNYNSFATVLLEQVLQELRKTTMKWGFVKGIFVQLYETGSFRVWFDRVINSDSVHFR